MNEADTISNQLYSLIVPKEILQHFKVIEVKDNGEEILIKLEEFASNVPKGLQGKEVALNGYLNPVTLQHYPQQGKACYLHLRRRRWKEKGCSDDNNHFNQYDFAFEGTQATKTFGAFLKRNCLTAIPSRLALLELS